SERRAACCRDRDRRPKLYRRRAERDPGQRDQAAALVRVSPRRDRDGAAAAALIAGAATRRGAMKPQNSFLRAWHAVFPSLRAWSRSNYVCARGRGGHEAFIAGGYRREYWR